MMKQKLRTSYAETQDFQFLGLPYKEDLVMYIILPKERFGLQQVLQNLTGEDFLKMINKSACPTEEVMVS